MVCGAHPLNDCSLPFYFYWRWVKILTSHCSILKDDSTHGNFSLSNMTIGGGRSIMVYTLVSPWIEPMSFMGKVCVSFGIFGILERRICWLGKEPQRRFSIAAVYCDFLVKLLRHYDSFHVRMINQYEATCTSQEWVGLYIIPIDGWPKRVACAGYFKEFKFNLVQISGEFIGTLPICMVGFQYFTLIKVKLNVRNAEPPTAFSGWMSCVRVDQLSRSSTQIQFTLFFERLDQLLIDPSRWWSPEVTPFLTYLGQAW